MKDMYKTFDDCKVDFYNGTSFDWRNRYYLLNKQSPDITWNYGDTVDICIAIPRFDIPENKSYKFLINCINFRGEVIHQVEKIPNDNCLNTITFTIDNIISHEVFHKGTYKCIVQVMTDEDDYCLTLEDDYKMYVN